MYTVHKRGGKIYYRNMGRQVRYWYHEAGITQTGLAQLMYIPVYMVGMWVSQDAGVGQEYMDKMLELFGVTLDEFVVMRRFMKKAV